MASLFIIRSRRLERPSLKFCAGRSARLPPPGKTEGRILNDGSLRQSTL
jgi:hypothetical protein